jgi:hypothetical protein
MLAAQDTGHHALLKSRHSIWIPADIFCPRPIDAGVGTRPIT